MSSLRDMAGSGEKTPTLSASSFAFGSVDGGSGRLQASSNSRFALVALGTNPTLSATFLAPTLNSLILKRRQANIPSLSPHQVPFSVPFRFF